MHFSGATWVQDVQHSRGADMEVALMVPCYVDMFYPRVGIATLELLERLGVDVVYPEEQTCCGQPMANSGCYEEAKATEEHFVKLFSDFEYIVTPSGSCTHHVRNKLTALPDSSARARVTNRVYDLVEFLHDIVQVHEYPWAAFDHTIALHTSCSAIRGLGMTSMSERVHDVMFSKPKRLLEGVRGVKFAEFDRVDECCGFGGTFSVTEEAVAAKMGYDKIGFMSKAQPEYIVSSDMSCLMHLQGCAKRMSRDFGFLHVAEILNGVNS